MSIENENGNFAKPVLAPVRVLNLYAGIGGNRKHWENVEVTAIEYNEEIANVYKQLHPNDNVIVTDAHDYLAKHWREFDFIWSSPPCQSHSKVRMMASKSGSYDAVMPDMKLWSEIIFLQNFTKNTDIKFVVENVKPYYDSIRAAKTALYARIADTTVTSAAFDTYDAKASQWYSAINRLTFEHFKKVRSLLQPNQQADYDKFIQKMMQRNRKDSSRKN
jgi:hypothetical protein